MIDAAPEFLDLAPGEPLRIRSERHSPEGRYPLSATDQSVQLLMLPGGDPKGPIAAIIPLDADTFGRIEAVTRLWRATQGRPTVTDTRLTPAQRDRLRRMIQAVDGRASGASYREIAAILFGAERVAEAPWKTSSLRDRVIGLVEDGKALISGEYLRLLRHRRRP